MYLFLEIMISSFFQVSQRDDCIDYNRYKKRTRKGTGVNVSIGPACAAVNFCAVPSHNAVNVVNSYAVARAHIWLCER